MGYHLTTASEPPATASLARKRMAGYLFASPKTHTPGPQVKKRGQRFHSPGMGRWLSRDPIGERGGRNLYGFVRNDPASKRDPFGLTNDIGDFGWEIYNPDFYHHEFFVRNPFAPVDGLNPALGGYEQGEFVDNTAYLERKYGWQITMGLNDLRLAVADVLQGKCSERPERFGLVMTEARVLEPLVFGRTWPVLSFLDANFIIGNVRFRAEDIEVNWTQHPSGLIKFSWKATAYVTDGLGWDVSEDNLANEKFHFYTTGSGGIGLYPDRWIYRGKWEDIEGFGFCPRCPADEKGDEP